MRIMALDVGTKTIGVAISNAEETLALGVTTLKRISLARDCEAVRELAASREAEHLVVGWPLTPAGHEGRAVERTRVFVEALRQALPVPVTTRDERFTTCEAEARFGEMDETLKRNSSQRSRGRKKSRRKNEKALLAVNATAAALILESFLKSRQGEAT